MSLILPKGKPQQKREESEAILTTFSISENVSLLGIRGYYLDTMGKNGENDRGIYDDAIFVISPDAYVSFNANTDPSIFKKGIATLKAGVHIFKKGKHGLSKPGGGYPALRAANENEELPVTRDGEGDSLGIAINIHKGGYGTTSSLGCQTIYPDQWDAFINLVYTEMDRYKQKTIPYLLIEK